MQNDKKAKEGKAKGKHGAMRENVGARLSVATVSSYNLKA